MSMLSKLAGDLSAINRVCGTSTAVSFGLSILGAIPEALRTGNLNAADRRMAGRSWPYNVQGVRLELDGRYFGGAREMYCRQVYFPTPAFAFHAGTTVMDLGANVGLFSNLAALAGCTVIAVEAQAGFVRELTALATSLGVAPRIAVEHALVGAATGVFSDPSAMSAASHFEGGNTPKLSMPELLLKHRVERLDLLKIDIEGSEFDLFRTSDQWLHRVDRLVMEVHPAFGSAVDLQGIAVAHGMSAELRDGHHRVVHDVPAEGGYLFALRQHSNH